MKSEADRYAEYRTSRFGFTYTDTQIAYAISMDDGNSDYALSIAINNPDEFDWCGERPEGFGEPHDGPAHILSVAARVV
jgi:hypothetical protein